MVWRCGTAGTDRLSTPRTQKEEVVAVSAPAKTAPGLNLGNDWVSAVLYFKLFVRSSVPHSPPPVLDPYVTANGSLATAVRCDVVERLNHEVVRIDRTTFEDLCTLEDNIWWPAYNDYADTLEQRVYAMFTNAGMPFFTIQGTIRSAAERAAHRPILEDEHREPHDIVFVNGKETILKQADDILPYEDLDALAEEEIAEIRARNPQPGHDDDDDNEGSGESDEYFRDGGGESSSSEEERGDGGRGHSLIGGSCDVGGRGSGPSYPPDDDEDSDNLYA